MPDTQLTATDMLERQTAVIGSASAAKGMPRRCKHGTTTNQRCDDCFNQHTRWYQLEIPDKSTTVLARYVLTDDGPQYHMQNLSRVRTAWMPGYLEVVDFRPIWQTWRALTDQAINAMDVDHMDATGATIDSFTNDELMELWARDTTPAKAAISLLSR